MPLIAPALLLFAGQTDLPPLPDMAGLAPLRYLHDPDLTPAMSQFVADEIAAGRCPHVRPVDGRYTLVLDVAVLIDAKGAVRATVPHAIACPTVEQYGAGLVSAFTRDNLVPRTGTGDQWYRTSLTFAWKQ